MTENLPTAVTTESEWRQMCEWMLIHCGLGFHPDTDMREYICPDGRPLFDPEFAASVLQPLLDQARTVITERQLCDIPFAIIQEQYPQIGADYR